MTTDQRLRDARRSAALGADPIADRAKFIAAHLRSGGRDPREDPRVGDVVESWGRDFPARRRVMHVDSAPGVLGGLPAVFWQEVREDGSDGVTHGKTLLVGGWQSWARGGEVLRLGAP